MNDFEVIGGHVVPVQPTREQRREQQAQREANAGGESTWQAYASRSNRILLQRKREGLWLSDERS